MRIKMAILCFILALIVFINATFVEPDKRIVVNQPEYNHIVMIDTCRIVTDTLGKPFCIWYQDKLYLPDPYQESDNQILKQNENNNHKP